MPHQSVLLHEVLEGLSPAPDDCVLDATINGGGHARALAERLSAKGTLVGIDVDARALERARKRLMGVSARVCLVHSNYEHLADALASCGVSSPTKIVFDLGLSSFQLDDPKRGFSFMRDGPLTMTLDDAPGNHVVTAFDVVNTWSESTLADIIKGFGEERFASRIARNIVTARSNTPIATTHALRDVVTNAIPRRFHKQGIHPATKTFQAIRIAVNRELSVLQKGLSEAFSVLAPSGRIAVISFHSLEDRIVKHTFRFLVQQGYAVLVTKKPITPSSEEIEQNPRARSAKLRIIQKHFLSSFPPY